jgi:dihydroorotase
VEALRLALADGTIDAVATDHAPHPSEDKECEWAAAAFGMLGLETALSVVIEAMVETGLLNWAGVADRMSTRPAHIGRVANQGGSLAPGQPASITVIDPDATWTVVPRELASRSRNTPYRERVLPGRVVHTVYAGIPTVVDSTLAVPVNAAWERS